MGRHSKTLSAPRSTMHHDIGRTNVRLQQIIASVQPLDAVAMAAARVRLDSLALLARSRGRVLKVLVVPLVVDVFVDEPSALRFIRWCGPVRLDAGRSADFSVNTKLLRPAPVVLRTIQKTART